LRNDLPRFADKLQIKASAKQQITVRRNSVSWVTIDDKVFPPECAEVTEHRPKNFGRMIYRQDYFVSFCRQIIRHKLSEFYSKLEKLIA